MQKLQFRILLFYIFFGLKIHIATLLSYLYIRKNILNKTKKKRVESLFESFFQPQWLLYFNLISNMIFKIL
jgi:hypothetical protein